jgi:hypothetical protein
VEETPLIHFLEKNGIVHVINFNLGLSIKKSYWADGRGSQLPHTSS